MSRPPGIAIGLCLAACLAAGEPDALAAALRMEDGDAFAADRMMQALYSAPIGKRRPLVERIASSARTDIDEVLTRMVQDEDANAAAAAIDAMAKRWPTSMQDAELVRMMIQRNGPAADAACRYAVAIRDDDALQALANRNATRPGDAASENALRALLGLPAGCGPEGWQGVIDTQQARDAAALAKAERLLGGTPLDAIAAITLIAGMRPIGSQAAMLLLRATEHPERAVRETAASILTTSTSPPAAAWRRQAEATRQPAEVAATGQAGSAPGDIAPPAVRPPATPPPLAAAQATASAEPASSGMGWLLLGTGTAAVAAAVWMLRRRRTEPGQHHGDRITWAR